MQETETTIQTLARDAYGQFETRIGEQGSYVTLKDDAPEWLTDLVREAHGDMLPDNYRYQFAMEAIRAIDDAGDADLDETEHEFADDVDVYTGELHKWLASNLNRQTYCDDARDEGLVAEDADITPRIATGQYMERREVFGLVLQGLRDRVEELDES